MRAFFIRKVQGEWPKLQTKGASEVAFKDCYLFLVRSFSFGKHPHNATSEATIFRPYPFFY